MKAALPLISLLCLGLTRPLYAQDTHLLVITGSAGDDEHAQEFQKWANALIDSAKRKAAVPDANITYLSEHGDAKASPQRAPSTRANVEHAFAELAGRARPEDEVVVVLIGHGSSDGRRTTFNLPGPDLAAEDYAALLAKIKSEHIAFVNTSSSSGGFLQPLAAPGRAIVTATRTGGERNETLFPAFFVEAFSSESADENRDGRVSVLEAFAYAKAKVVQAYEQKGTILTEHATLEDGHDGKLAATLFLESPNARAAAIATTADPTLRTLLQEKQALEDQIAALKLRKGSMDEARYDQELEKLVTELALKTRAIQQLGGRK